MSRTNDECVVLLVGGTGVGKSTLINCIANYFRQGTLHNLKVAIATEFFPTATERDLFMSSSESNINDVTTSKTTGCHKYQFQDSLNGRRFTFIDTPGLNDTRGNGQDDTNINAITRAAIDADHISAIIVIASGTEARVTATVMNTLARLAGNLPDAVIQQNLLLVLTKTDETGASFDIDYFAQKVHKPHKIFYMNNTAFCKDPDTWRKNKGMFHEISRNWQLSQSNIQKLLDSIASLQATSTQAFRAMKQARDAIKAQISSIMLDIGNLNTVKEKLDATAIGLTNSTADKMKYANYKTTMKVLKREFVGCDYYSTFCLTHVIRYIVCHEKCRLSYTPKTDASVFGGCACLSGEGCKKCGCAADSHYHIKQKLIQENVTIDSIIHDVKAQYDRATQLTSQYTSQKSQIERDLIALETTLKTKYKQVENLCQDLRNICSRFNFVNELKAVIDMMKCHAACATTSKARNEADQIINNLETLANQLTENRQ